MRGSHTTNGRAARAHQPRLAAERPPGCAFFYPTGDPMVLPSPGLFPQLPGRNALPADGCRWWSGCVFVEQVVPLPVPVAAARDRLPELCRGGGLQDAAAGAFRDGRTLLCRAGCTVLVDQVTVRSLSAYRRGPSLIVPVRWVATGPGRDLCPPLDADLELDPTPGGACRLLLCGCYRAPVGQLDGALGWVLLQRVTHATTHGFLTRIGGVIMAGLNASPVRVEQYAPERLRSRRPA